MKDMTKKQRTKVRRKFATHYNALCRLVENHVGTNNYAGSSSLAQLDRVFEKWIDCTDEYNFSNKDAH
jgi:hypothetical protein